MEEAKNCFNGALLHVWNSFESRKLLSILKLMSRVLRWLGSYISNSKSSFVCNVLYSQCSMTIKMHFLFSVYCVINSLYMFWVILADLQEALYIQQLVYVVCTVGWLSAGLKWNEPT
jgi:hypothetical protein